MVPSHFQNTYSHHSSKLASEQARIDRLTNENPSILYDRYSRSGATTVRGADLSDALIFPPSS